MRWHKLRMGNSSTASQSLIARCSNFKNIIIANVLRILKVREKNWLKLYCRCRPSGKKKDLNVLQDIKVDMMKQGVNDLK